MNSAPSRPLLLHYHVFKNGGTSFNWALEKALGKRFQEYDSSGPGGILSPDDLVQYVASRPETEAISSHHALLPPPSIEGRTVFASILLRDPICRIRSIYAFERQQQTATRGALKAKELNFKRYVEWRLSETPAMLCNFQVYFCSRTEKTKHGMPNESQFHQAVANLDQVAIVGTVERYNEWLALAQTTLAIPFPGISLQPNWLNVTVSTKNGTSDSKLAVLEGLRADLGCELVNRLLESNELDTRLFQIADTILSHKLAATGKQGDLLNEYREARVHLGDK